MYISASLPLAVILSLQLVEVSSAPSPAPGDVANPAVPMITKEIDCVLFDTPMSCDSFCFATFCMGLPHILSHETDKGAQDKNRDQSGCNVHPFQDAGLKKYGTTRKSNDATIADEYPLASSLEGGVGTQGYGRAVIQGATAKDQQGQANWSKKLWSNPEIPQGAKIEIVLTNWDPKLSPYCEAKKNNDQKACHNPNSLFYRREDTNNGPGGAASFEHVGI